MNPLTDQSLLHPKAPARSGSAAEPATEAGEGSTVHDRSIGRILADLRELSAEQVERVLAFQREKSVRFGEAAVALGLVTKEDVLVALSQQFHYPYVPQDERRSSPEVVTLNEPFSLRAEGFRALRTQLMMRVFGEAGSRRALAIVSPDSGDGKSYCAANLAVALAQLGGRTLLVDADLRGPRQHELFQLPNRTGLSGILGGRSDSHVVLQVAGVPSLFVLPAGTTPPNPLELFERPGFALLMRELVSKFDHVVVDTAAASLGADATVVAARCGAALVIARRDRSRVRALDELTASFAGGRVEVAGVVFNEY